MNHDSNYGDRATLSKADFPTTAALLGNWEIKIKLKTAQDSRSLTDGELGNTYLVLAFDAKSQP